MAVVTDVGAAIREALAARLKRDVTAIQDSDDLRNDLGLDSLDMIELLFKIEEVFDLEIPNEELVKIATVGDVTAHVERRLAAMAAAPLKTRPAARARPAAKPVAAAKQAGSAPKKPAAKPVAAAMRAAAPKRAAARKKGA